MAPAPASNARPSVDRSGRASRQDDAILEAAWCYYHDGQTQSEIAARLGVSRASVVNYLAEARRRDKGFGKMVKGAMAEKQRGRGE